MTHGSQQQTASRGAALQKGFESLNLKPALKKKKTLLKHTSF